MLIINFVRKFASGKMNFIGIYNYNIIKSFLLIDRNNIMKEFEMKNVQLSEEKSSINAKLHMSSLRMWTTRLKQEK